MIPSTILSFRVVPLLPQYPDACSLPRNPGRVILLVRQALTCGLLLLSLLGCTQVKSYTTSVLFASSGTRAAKDAGVKLGEYDHTYEPCPAQTLTDPDVKKEWKRRMNAPEGEDGDYVVKLYVDRIFVRHLDDFHGSNAELLVVTEVRDGVHDPVRTVVKYAEDAPIDRVTLDESNIVIYPPLAHTRFPYDVRVKILELDEGQENEINNIADILDILEKGAKALFGFVLPGGVTEGLKTIGMMDKNDIELDRTVSRVIPTLTYISESDAENTRTKHGGAWKDHTGKCHGKEIVNVEKLDLTPHKSIVVLKNPNPKDAHDQAEGKAIEDFIKNPSTYYRAGKLCRGGIPKISDNNQTTVCTEYDLSTYVIIRVETYIVQRSEIEKTKDALSKHNQAYVDRLRKIGLTAEDTADTIWEQQ
jgi:hypothetical protein